jgi:sulfatase modifying factor 1
MFGFRSNSFVAWSLATIVSVLALSPTSWAASTLGLVKDKPASGRFVKTDQGYMVPYTVKVANPDTANVAIEMVPIPGGTFMMGSAETEKNRGKSEGPQIEVVVPPFWIGKYEITWDQYDPFVSKYQIVTARGFKLIPKDKFADAISFPTPLYDQEGVPMVRRMGREDGFPAASMTQLAAKQYSKWLSKRSDSFYRLPSAAEWEYACRAGTTTAFSYGNDEKKMEGNGIFFDNSEWADGKHGHKDTDSGYRKVGSKKPNPWGLYDMHGNLTEWVLDQYVKDHYKKFAGKGPVKAIDTIAWPTTRYPRETRGGHYDSDAKDCRSASRIPSEKDWKEEDPQLPKSEWWYTSFYVGFRMVRPLAVPAAKTQSRYWDADIERMREVSLNPKEKQVRSLVPLAKPK